MKLYNLPPAFRNGSVKSLHLVPEGGLAQRYGLRTSTFDRGTVPQDIPGSDVAVCAAAVQSFKVAKSLNIRTCFMQKLDPVTILFDEFEIVMDRNLRAYERKVFLPLEFITRWRVAGRRWREFKAGTKLPMDYGFPTNDLPEEGTPFPAPVHEWTTKWAPEDVEVTLDVAREMAAISEEEMHEIWALLDTLNGGVNAVMALAGLTRLDCKNEIGRDEDGKFTVLDTFGNPHEDRIVKIADLRAGKIVHYSKEKLRQKLIKMGYKKALDAARQSGEDLPNYPHIDEAFLAELGDDWKWVAEKYCSISIPG